MSQHHLITNVDRVKIGGVGIHASAILLTRDDDPTTVRSKCKLRLFGPDPAWEVIEWISIPTIDHAIASVLPPAAYKGWQITQTAYTLTIGQTAVGIHTSRLDGSPPRVTSYDDGASITKVWADLVVFVASDWHRPFMPVLSHHPPSTVITTLKRSR